MEEHGVALMIILGALVVLGSVWDEPGGRRSEAYLASLDARRSMQRSEESRAAHASPPEVARLRELLETFRQDDSRADCALAMGDVYRAGAYPRFRSDPDAAALCYEVASKSRAPEIAAAARTRLQLLASVPAEDEQGPPLPGEFARELAAAGNDGQLDAFHAGGFGQYADALGRGDALGVYVDAWEGGAQAAFTEPAAPVRPRMPPVVQRDSQNVHDHAVQSGLQAAIKDLPPCDRKSYDAVKAEMREAIARSDATPEVKADAARVLDSLTGDAHSRLGADERTVLCRVWEKVRASGDHTGVLVRQLASGVEHGHVVCSSGKIARIVGTLDGLDDAEPKLRPVWAVREEIMNMAAQVRESTLAAATPEERAAYEDPYGQSDLSQRMETGLRAAVNAQYVEKLGMSASVVDPVLQEAAAGF